MKYIKVNDETHQALKMYCIVHQKNMQDIATEWISERLLKEAGLTGPTN